MEKVDFYANLGRQIAAIRKGQGLTQTDLSKKTGLSRASIANIEAGKQRVFLDQAYDIARCLEIENADLIKNYDKNPLDPRSKLNITGAKILSKDQERSVSEIISNIRSEI